MLIFSSLNIIYLDVDFFGFAFCYCFVFIFILFHVICALGSVIIVCRKICKVFGNYFFKQFCSNPSFFFLLRLRRCECCMWVTLGRGFLYVSPSFPWTVVTFCTMGIEHFLQVPPWAMATFCKSIFSEVSGVSVGKICKSVISLQLLIPISSHFHDSSYSASSNLSEFPV